MNLRRETPPDSDVPGSILGLIEAARRVRELAYAPYSKFAVGAVVECGDGELFTGCNIENASYGLTLCAERVALAKAISAGRRDLVRLLVIADTTRPVSPCGACRQLIFELAGPTVEVILVNLAGQRRVMTAAELLPYPFDPEDL